MRNWQRFALGGLAGAAIAAVLTAFVSASRPEAAAEPVPEPEPEPKKHPLDGKKILVVGNSYAFYGKMVVNQPSVEFSARKNDRGMLKTLCAKNGAQVSVTNWTFGAHQFFDLFGDSCTVTGRACTGSDHKPALTDRCYDYVVLSACGREFRYDWVPQIQQIMDFFRAENPDVRFVFLVNPAQYGYNPYTAEVRTDVLEKMDTLRDMGIRVADWGRIVCDIIDGTAVVPGSTFSYDKNSFIVNQSDKDGYHPNLLAGYITTLVTYCAMTGEKAVDQPDDFVKAFDPEGFRQKYYANNLYQTNFVEILNSETEMDALRQLVDSYLDTEK